MINDGFTDAANQIIGTQQGSCLEVGTCGGCGKSDYYDRWRRKSTCGKCPRTQVGLVPANRAILEIVNDCSDAIQDLPSDLRSYILGVIYAPYVTPDEVMRVAYVLRQCPIDSPFKQRCTFVAGCIQQMGYSRKNLDQWTLTARGF